MSLATDIYSGNVFLIHGIGTIDGGRGFRTGKNRFKIGENTFYDRKNKIPMKILESKRSEIGIIAEFRGIPNEFPNLADASGHCLLLMGQWWSSLTEAVANGGHGNGGLCRQWSSSTKAAVGWRDNDAMALAAMASSANGGGGNGGRRCQLCIGG